MNVAICKECKETLDGDDEKLIMKNVIKGWDVETEFLVQEGKWTQEKKDNYMSKYGKRQIIKNIESHDQKDIDKIYSDYIKDKNGCYN